MSYMLETCPEAVLEAIQKFTAVLHATISDPNRPNLPFVYQTYMFGKGVHTMMKGMNVHIPLGVSYDEYLTDFTTSFRKLLVDKYGLSSLRIYGQYVALISDTEIIGIYDITIQGAKTISIRAYGPPDLVKSIHVTVQATFTTKRPPVIRRLKVVEDAIKMSETPLPVDEKPVKADVFYPNFELSPAELWKEFAASASNVLLLIGPPGTGKSTFIREVLHARGWDDRVYLADRDDVLADPGLADYIRDLPQSSVMVTEDSDKLVAKREDGNSGMAALLNATAGIIPTDTKIIISTNLTNLRKVDEALLRPGRTFKVLEFKALTVDQAHALRDAMQLPNADFSLKDEVTLAEALNWVDADTAATQKPNRIGFI